MDQSTLPTWVYIIVAFGGLGGISALIPAIVNGIKSIFKIGVEKEQDKAQAEKLQAEAEKTTIEGLRIAFETMQKSLESRMEDMQEEIDGLKKRIEDITEDLAKKNKCLEIAKQFIRELIARFDALRNEFYEELDRWPETTKPDGWEEYKE